MASFAHILGADLPSSGLLSKKKPIFIPMTFFSIPTHFRKEVLLEKQHLAEHATERW